MNVLVFDCGNALLKGKNASREETIPHGLVSLSEAEYSSIVTRAGRAGAPVDYVRVNGQPYAVGEAAERHGTLTRRSGASRYTPDYYGALAAAMLGRVYDRGGEVAVFGSHPPVDVGYRDDLMGAVLGEWEVEIGGQVKRFRASYVNSFDEPLGGLFNVILAADGRHYARTDLNGGRALVIDIGGHTTDWLSVNPGGEIDYSLQHSTAVGILEALRDFERSVKARYKGELQAVTALPAARVRDGFRTGALRASGRDLDCEAEASEAANRLVNRIGDAYQNVAGGGVDYDSIILTGGGAALLYDRLQPVLHHGQVLLADDAASIHLANVRGGLKLWRLLEAESLL